MDCFYKSGYVFRAWSCSCFFSLVLVAVALVSASITAAVAQDASSREANRVAIHGTVLDSAGNPVRDALVRVERKGNPDAVTTTDQQGSFIFPVLPPGTYLISAEKSGLRSRELTVAGSAQANQSDVHLVLDTVGAVQSNPNTASPSSTETMAFADKPNFTVAGITDWTAVGGHGSDSSLRTSEALARETASLKPESSGAVANGSPGETETKLRAALAASPKSFEANHQLGEFCLHEGSYREAIPPLETAYQIDPSNAGNEFDLAAAYEEAGDFRQAREHIQKLLVLENTADLHRAAGDLDEAMGDSVAAEHEYAQAVRLDPSEQNYFAWGSELLLHRAVWPAAEVFRKGSEAHPKSARMLAALGAALFASALYDEAALRLCDAADLNPADTAPYVFLSKIDMAAPAPLACVEPKLLRFVQERPGDARANYYYGMAVWKRQMGSEDPRRMEEVQTSLTKAVEDDPKYGEAYLQLGNLYADKRNYDKAVSFYTEAIEVNPQLSEAYYKLGVVYERIGEPAKAKQKFQLHDEIEKAQAAAVERQRQEVKQFLVVLQNKPTVH